MDQWNNVMKEARTRTICRSVSLLITPPFHHPINPLARFASLPTVPSLYHSITPLFPIEKYSLSRQWSSLFPTLYFLFPFLPDYSTPLPLSTSSPSRVIVKNIPGLSRYELKRQIVYKEPRFRFFFNLYVQRAVNAYTHKHKHKHKYEYAYKPSQAHQYLYPSAHESYSYTGFLSLPQLTFPSTYFFSELRFPVSESVSKSGFTPSSIVFKHLQHIRSIKGGSAADYIQRQASPMRPRPPDAIRRPRGKLTPLSFISPSLFFPSGIHTSGDTDTYTAVSERSQPGPKPQTRSIYTENRLHLRKPSIFTPSGPGLPGELPDSARGNWTRLKFTKERRQQPQHHRQHHEHRQVFIFAHPGERFHKSLPLSLSSKMQWTQKKNLFSISKEEQPLQAQAKKPLTYTHPGIHLPKTPAPAVALRDIKVPTGSPESSLMSTGMRIPISPTRKYSPGSSGQFPSRSVSSFLTLFHYNHDTNTIRENNHLSLAIRRKIATQTIGIKDITEKKRIFSPRERKQEMQHPPLHLPLHYLKPWQVVGARHFGSESSVGPVGHGHQDGKGLKRSAYGSYDTHDMQNAPEGSRMSSNMDIDLNQLTNRVYDMLERKIKNEKERRGW